MAEIGWARRSARLARLGQIALDVVDRTRQDIQIVMQLVERRLGDHQLAVTQLEFPRPLSGHPVPLTAPLRTELPRSTSPRAFGQRPPTPPAPPNLSDGGRGLGDWGRGLAGSRDRGIRRHHVPPRRFRGRTDSHLGRFRHDGIPARASSPPADARRQDVVVSIDLPRIERAVREILLAIGEDPDRDGLVRTPGRVARMFGETMAGLDEDPAAHLQTVFEASHDEMVMVRDVPFASTCEHHLVPFIGVAHVAYIPGPSGSITGLSKIARLVDGFARRPQVQERLTTQIADALCDVLIPAGALVVLEAEHLCMSIRGVKKPGALTVTSAVRGHFHDDARARAEAMSFINGTRGR